MVKSSRLLTFLIVYVLTLPVLAHAGAVPDTGQSTCYDDQGTVITCPHPGQPFHGQDAQYTINPPSYTKLDAEGNDLSDESVECMVRDNVTGLIWEVKTDDGSVHDKDNQYTWCDSNPDTNRGDAGTCSDGADAEDFIQTLNDSEFGGFSDWRLPTIMELATIVTREEFGPAINSVYFPSTASSNYFSSTTMRGWTWRAWHVEFHYGRVFISDKSEASRVRAVRGGQESPWGRLIVNGDGTVTDTLSGLMWQQEAADRMKWEAALTYCENLNLAEHDDWRLPNVNELQSLVDYSTSLPAIDSTAFPDTDTNEAYYWSSTHELGASGDGWPINFRYGFVGDAFQDGDHSRIWVHAVRGGQHLLPGHLAIISPEQASSSNIGGLMPITWAVQGIAGNVRLSISRQGGKDGTFEMIADNTDNNGSYEWRVTGAASVNCILKIESLADLSKSSTQGLFTIIAALSGTPDSRTSQANTSLTVAGDLFTSYKYKLDDGSYGVETPVTTEISLTGLSDGHHTLYVIGENAEGNWLPEESSITVFWVVDTQPPEIIGLEDDSVPAQSKAWEWHADEEAEFRFAVDRNPEWVPMGDFVSENEATKLGGEGIWYLHVQAEDVAGNVSDVVTVSAVLDGRFVDNGDGTVTDTDTGLMWQQASAPAFEGSVTEGTSFMDWYDAGVYCALLTLGGYDDWRLPEKEELVSLVDLSRQDPAIDTDYFPETFSASYWSSNVGDDSGADAYLLAWAADFRDGSGGWTFKSSWRHVRAVRGLAPVITGLSTDATPSQSKTWTWDADDASIVTYRYTIDQSTTWAEPSGTYSDIKSASISNVDGTWYLHAQAKDSEGNVSDVVTVSAVLDNTPPVGTIAGNPADLTNQDEASLTAGGVDVTHYKYSLNGDEFGEEHPMARTIELTNLVDGSYTVDVIGRDSAGNWQPEGSPTTITWVVDTRPPEITGLADDSIPVESKTWEWYADEPSAFRFAVDKSLEWTPAGDLGNVNKVTKLGADGVWYLHVQAVDVAGNMSDVVTVSAVLDSAVINNEDGTVTDTCNALVWQIEGSEVEMDWRDATSHCRNLSLAGISDWRVPNIWELRSIRLLDKSNVIPIPSATCYWSSTVNEPYDNVYNVCSYDDYPAVRPKSYGNIVRCVSGPERLLIVYYPRGGTFSVGDSMNIDWITGHTEAGFKVSLSRQSGASGTFETIREDTRSNYTNSWWPSVTGPASDDCVIKVESLEDSSKQNASCPFTIQDTIAVLSETPQSVSTQKDVLITVGGNSVMSYKYSIDQQPYGSEMPIETAIQISDLSEGPHTLSILGHNSNGNWQLDPTTITWIVDTVAPVVTEITDDLIPRRSKSWLWGSVDSTSVTYRYYIDQNATRENLSGDFSDLRTASIEGVDGTWYLHVQAKDAAGYESDVVSVSAVLDNTPPVATISGSPPVLTNHAEATLIVGGEDVTHYKYRLNGGAFGQEYPVATPIELTSLADGAYTVDVIGCDSVGNWQPEDSPTTVYWIVDTRSSAIMELKLESVYPAFGAVGEDLKATLIGTGFDVNTRVSIYLGSESEEAIADLEETVVNSSTNIFVTLPLQEAAGNYTIRVFNQEESNELMGAVTLSESIQKQKAILIEGHGPAGTQRVARYAYRVLLARGFLREDIYYLGPVTNVDVDGDYLLNDVDDYATIENLRYAVTDWAASTNTEDLLLSMTGHGGSEGLWINETTVLTYTDLDEWLDSFQLDTSARVIKLNDSCMSGSSIPVLLPPEGRERIIMTSASADRGSLFDLDGHLSFFFQFWAAMFSGPDMYYAYTHAKDMVATFQTANIDADGDGIANEAEDKRLANGIMIGRAWYQAADIPIISKVSQEQTLNGETQATIQAEGIISASGISRVWAVIMPPDYEGSPDTPITDLPKVDLISNDDDGIYRGTYESFTAQGTYLINVYASDTKDTYSIPETTSVIQTADMTDTDDDSTDGVENDTDQGGSPNPSTSGGGGGGCFISILR